MSYPTGHRSLLEIMVYRCIYMLVINAEIRKQPPKSKFTLETAAYESLKKFGE